MQVSMQEKWSYWEEWSNSSYMHHGKTEGLSKYLDPPTRLLRGPDKKGLGRALTTMQCNFICLILLQVVQKKLKDCLFICASSQHLGKPANENAPSELLRNLDRLQWDDERKCWKHQLLLKQDQFIKVYLRGMRAYLSPMSVHFLSSLP